jgi:hypothetical protein
MAVYPVPNNPLVAKVAMVFSHDQRTYVNTFHVSLATEWTLPDLQDLANFVQDWWSNWYKLCVPVTVSLVQIQTRKLDPTDPIAYDKPVTPPITGVRTGTDAPGNVTVTQSFRTGFAGRRFRGRLFSVGVAEGDITVDDRITSALVTLLSNAAQNLIAGLLVNFGQMVIFHRPLPIPNPVYDNTFTPVISFVIENILDAMRSRLPGRGR